MEQQPKQFTSVLRVSEYDTREGVLKMEGETIVTDSKNGTAPEFVRMTFKLTDLKVIQHLGAWVHIALDKDWYLDLLFSDADDARDFHDDCYADLVRFYSNDPEDDEYYDPEMDANERLN